MGIDRKVGTCTRFLASLVVLMLVAACSKIPAAQQPSRSLSQPQTPATPATEVPKSVHATTSAENPAAENPAAEGTVTDRAKKTTTTSAAGQRWLMMLYSDADDQVLEEDLFIDLNEIERVGSTDRVQIVAQMDRFKGAFKGDGNWTSTKRFFISKDHDLSTIKSKELADLGEVNMGDQKTLVDFATWAIKTYPADKYVLVLSDHGAGWPGGWNDPDPKKPGKSGTPLDANEDILVLPEIRDGLKQIIQQTGIGGFEIVGFDACLMSHIEVYTALAPYAHYAVASQEVEPAMGWAYSSFLQKLVDHPDMDGAALSKEIVQSYISQDVRIIDDDARKQFLQAIGAKTTFSAAQVAEHFSQEVTLAAVNLQALPNVLKDLDTLVQAMKSLNQNVVARSRSYAQPFDHIFGQDIPSSYIDLGHFAAVLDHESGDATVTAAVKQLTSSMKQAVVAEKHGSERPGANGISIYFPTSKLYTNIPAGRYDTYTTIAKDFVDQTLWDNFLSYHYTGKEIVTGVPQTNATFISPGASKLQVEPLQLSDAKIPLNGKMTISTKVSGENVGYIYFYLGYYDKPSNSILFADMEFVNAKKAKEIGGVLYPDWQAKNGVISIDYDWEPTLYEITDGKESAFALLAPRTYGKTETDNTYSTRGIYTFVDTGQQRYADLIFDGVEALIMVVGYANEDGTGSPYQITPQDGDTFTVLEQWYKLPDTKGDEIEMFEQEGGTLTFGDTAFTWQAVTAPPGNYEAGIIAQDLDGNYYEEYTDFKVKNKVK